jgi:uncharacterized membrane protein YedE/YeeE
MNWIILIMGIIFGSILQYANLNRFNTISGLATLENYTVAKAIAAAIGIGVILISLEIGLGFASYHLKPFIVGGIVIGGLIFGVGMAILGYCPGTLAVSLGEGSIDALFGIIGGLFSGLVYTLLTPSLHGILGPDLGNISLHSVIGSNVFVFYPLVIVIGALFVGLSFWLNKREQSKDYKWFFAGVGMAVLSVFVFLTSLTDRIIGASTSYPYIADVITGTTQNDAFEKIKNPGHWEMIFLLGAFISAVVISNLKKEFKFTIIHSNWGKYKGKSIAKRLIWSFIGGFILIFGARMAGGCTSGHIISGGMQLSVSSLVFAVFVFTGFLITGKLFYKRAK